MKRTNQEITSDDKQATSNDPAEEENGQNKTKCPKMDNSSAVVNGESHVNHSTEENDSVCLRNLDSPESEKFANNSVAVRELLKFLPLRDWITLENLNKNWRTAMLAQWQKVKELNGKELAVAIRILNGPELKWRQISYLKNSRDRKVRVSLLRDWIMAR